VSDVYFEVKTREMIHKFLNTGHVNFKAGERGLFTEK